jgi:hypothetical protein
MKTKMRWVVILSALAFSTPLLRAQSSQPLDCNCLQKLPVLQTNACRAFIPDLCAVMTNCYQSTVVPPPPLSCSQSPLPGTPVGPGPHTISISVTDLGTGQSSTCAVTFAVSPLPGCTFALLCASNKTVECGTTWSFNPPTWTNACSPPPGTPSNGVILTVISTVTNGTCPQVITRTWQGVDDCQNHDQCSQTITVADTLPPTLNCACITNNAAFPVNLTVYACASSIPDLCLPARICASDLCGVTGCSQSPAAGTAVGPGVFPITVTVYDCASNSASCVLNYTVICTNNPNCINLTCPTNLLVFTCSNSAVVFYPPPTASSVCGVAITNITSSPPSGSTFLLGTNIVTCTAADALGNTAQCTFTITVAPGPNCCSLVPVLRLYSGATNNVPGVLPGGALDKQFLTGPPFFSTPNPYVLTVINGWWLPNSSLSKWVGPNTYYAYAPIGVFYYTNRFFLCSTSQASITGRWAGDDSGRILLNGVATGNVLPNGWAFTNWTPVSITSGFGPGWNQLVFAITNALYSPTGLRTEINGSACCNNCIGISCPPNIVTNICANGRVITFPSPVANSACGAIVSVTASPPSGSFFPIGTTVVTCTAIDSQGNAATCSFTVTVNQLATPVTITCPPDQIRWTCSSTAVAYYAATATGNVGPIAYTPPSGSTFPLGTNYVTCTATNACGSASCTFRVIVKSVLTGPPNFTFTAGLPDNFALPVDPANTSACMIASVSGFLFWKKFDATPVNTLFGHRFTGLPTGIVQAQLVSRMRPENDGVGVGIGSDNDGLFIGLSNCTTTGWSYIASIKTLPGAGGSWMPGHPATTFTNTLSPAIIALMNSSSYLDVMVHDDTTVDYLQLRVWTCPPPINPNGGIPHWSPNLASPAALAITAQPQLDAFGPIGTGPALSATSGDPSVSTDVQIGIGGGQAFGFTTVLDMNAPEGARIDVSVPTDAGTNAPLFSIVKGKCPPKCNWDIKTNKKFFADGGPECRVSAVNTNGDLLDSFTATEADAETDSLLSLVPEAGVDQFPVSFLFDSTTGTITVTYPGSVARRLCGGLPCPRGWDGTIKGRVAGGGRKGWDGTVRCPCFDDEASRIVFTPMGGSGVPPRSSLVVSSTGLSELILASEHLYTMGGQEVTAVDAGPIILESSAAGDAASFASADDYSGISLDLGRSASFDVGIHHFENGDIPTEEQLFRISGPRCIGCLTNRPPPPPIDVRLSQQASNSIGASIDFSALAASGIQIQLYSNGIYIAFGDVPAGAILPDDPLVLDRWPERLGLMGSNAVVRLTSSELMTVDGFQGDEIRFVPSLTADSPPFDFASELDCRTPLGMESLLYDLQRVPACAPAALKVANSPTGVTFTWSGDGYRLLGAESLDGPWIELGVASPVLLPPHAPQRFFRLVCQ